MVESNLGGALRTLTNLMMGHGPVQVQKISNIFTLYSAKRIFVNLKKSVNSLEGGKMYPLFW